MQRQHRMSVSKDSDGSVLQERYHDYILRKMKEERENEANK